MDFLAASLILNRNKLRLSCAKLRASFGLLGLDSICSIYLVGLLKIWFRRFNLVSLVWFSLEGLVWIT